MADKTPDPAELRERLYKEIKDAKFGMLGVVGDGQMHHFQPMTCEVEEETGSIFFYTRDDTDMAKSAQGGADVMLTVMAKDQEFQACVHGKLTVSNDRSRIDKFWSPFVAAWFPDGKDDPHLALVQMDAVDARVWVSRRGPLNYAFEVAKANATHTLPNVGTSSDVKL